MYTSACCHFVPCVPNFFQENYTEGIQGMEAVPIADEKGKGKRRKEKPATQESSWNSPQLPNMTEEMGRRQQDQFSPMLSPCWLKQVQGECLQSAEDLGAKGSSLWSLLL